MVSPDGRVRVMDFGLARATDSLARVGTMSRSDRYSAPASQNEAFSVSPRVLYLKART